MRTVIVTTALTSLATASPIVAQQASLGRLEGTVAPWTGSRAVYAAQVSLLNIESESSTTRTAAVDAAGRFRFDSLPVGRYIIQVSHPTLDSLDVTLPPGRLAIVGNGTVHADFSLPPGRRLREMVCPGVALGPDKVAIAGRVVDAETDAPLVGAHVVAAWTELSVDRKSRTVVAQGKQAVVSTGRRGEYRLCGVPAVKSLELQLQHADRAGAAVKVTVLPDEGVAVRDFSLSTHSAPTLAALDSLDRLRSSGALDSTSIATSRVDLALSGGATLTGMVRAASGQPVAGADVRVRHGGPEAVTDDSGRFVLGGLPSGTQVLLVRRLGFAETELPVQLRLDRPAEVTVSLARAVTLDSVRVTASRWKLADFEHNRKTNLQGHFLTLSQIQASQAKKTSDLLPLLGGYAMMGRDGRVRVRDNYRDVNARYTCRSANVVIDGVDGQGIDDVQPNQIAGIELYKNAAAAPLEYAGRADCGVIVIWLRPGPRWQGWRALFGKRPST